MALTFPSTPSQNQIYTAPNGTKFIYDGVKWIGKVTKTMPIASDTILGGIKVGSGLNVTLDGVISISTAPLL